MKLYRCAECGRGFQHYWKGRGAKWIKGVGKVYEQEFPNSLLRHRDETRHMIYPPDMHADYLRRRKEAEREYREMMES